MSANDILFIVFAVVFTVIGIVAIYANWIRSPSKVKRVAKDEEKQNVY